LTDTAPVLAARDVRKSYGRVEALRGATLELRPREIHALIGDNGAGKSTLVKTISGVIPPTSGTIEVEGRALSMESPRSAQALGIETVYQDLALAPDLDAAENIFLGRELIATGLAGRLGVLNRRAMRKRAAEELATLGIALPSIKAPIGSLSGGQRQAVAIARGAIWARHVLILDEPTAALGARQTGEVLALMQRTRDEKGLAQLWISHNMREVLEVADRITVLRLGTTVAHFKAGEASAEQLLGAMTGALEVAHGG
jgi:simple sugar transport system ATP-binding protein